MKVFRQLRWKLTLSYTLVTVSALLVILLIMAGIVFTRLFIPEDYLEPEQIIDGYMNSDGYLFISHFLSQSPVDTKLVNFFLSDPQLVITSSELISIGALRFSVSTNATFRVLILDADGILLGTFRGGTLENAIGDPVDASRIPGLEGPLSAALAGEKDSSRLYTVIEPNNRYIMAIPIFDRTGGDGNLVLGVLVVFFDYFPTRADIPAHILNLAGRSLIIFLLGVGLMGAIFGSIFSRGLATRFNRISTITDLWSTGDFSRYIEDKTGDEIAHFTRRLDNMAEQLQSLLRQRQDMAVSEERNRLARDLHDSAKQQALAASLELGTALTLYERDPGGAKKHLLEAETLVDSVRQELTNLVDELRPQTIDGQDFSEILKEHATEWSHRSGIELNLNVERNDRLSSEARETLFRIAQEALANVARHSSASRVDVFLEYEANIVSLTIKDNGRGFEARAHHDGLGLRSMRERAEVMSGNFMVESVPGQGTQILVTLPLEN